MKKFTFILVGFVLAFTTLSAQNLSLSWEGEPIGDEMVVYGAQTDAEIVAHAILTNDSDHSMDIKVLRERIEMQENANSQFCWAGSCYPPNTDLSFDMLTLGAGQSCGEEDFSAHYLPNGVWGDSYIKYTFFNENNESEAISVVVQFSATTTGIGDVIEETAIAVYPNPANNFVNIESQSRIERIGIYDLTGKAVYNTPVDQNKLKVNIDFLESGIYLIKLETENGTRVEKLNVR
jgi:hypothetical protein